MSGAVLIGPKPEDGMTLSEREYAAVKNLIQLHRQEGSKEARAIFEAVRACDKAVRKDFGVERRMLTFFLADIMRELGEHAEEFSAVFTDGWDELHLLGEGEESEIACVAALCKILKEQSWLRTFLVCYLPLYVQKPKPPMEMMWALSEEATNFQSDIDQAKCLLAAWPQLVQPEAGTAQEVH